MDPQALAGTSLFEGLSDEDLSRIAAEMRENKHDVGAVLIAEGDLPVTLFVILEGTVTVHRAGEHVADLGPGDFVGETGVISLGARNATVIATTPLRVAVLMGWTVRQLTDEYPLVGERIEAARAERQPN